MNYYTLLLLPLVLAEVIFVAEFTRHGSRSTLRHFSWSSDPLPPITLLPEGKAQHIAVGQHVNATYAHLIQNPAEVSARSSNFTRTIESAQAQLQGMFNGTDHGVNVTTKNSDEDNLLVPFSCPRVLYLVSDNAFTSEYADFQTKLEENRELVVRLLDGRNWTSEDLYIMADSVCNHHERGLALP